MKRLGGVHEEGRRARARERGRDFAADVARLAHARDNHARLAGQNSLHRTDELGIDALLELQHGLGLNLQRFQRFFLD